MKCTGKEKKRRKRKRNHGKGRVVLFLLLAVLGCAGVGSFVYSRVVGQQNLLEEYGKTRYNRALFQGDLYATELCVAAGDVSLPAFSGAEGVSTAGLFSVTDKEVLYGKNLQTQLYPASTTKLMTAYVILQYGNLDDVVTVRESATQFEAEAQLCGLSAGDQLTLECLLNGLLLYSGNDCAVAAAEQVGGSVEGFVAMMNEEACKLGATHTHFTNPTGLHDEQHYTTGYDLYLIFNACMQDSRFLEIISKTTYTATFTDEAGTAKTMEWPATNYYSAGLVSQPSGIQVIGGKTGTTNEAGSCVILYSQNQQKESYISLVMGAGDKDSLYQTMTGLLEMGETQE